VVLAIGGPTASGKTDLAIDLAERLGGEIVNADSRQVYVGMDIGTAKPTAGQRARAPHHLLNLVRPSDPFTLADYLRAADGAIDAIQARDRLPILVGGTGLYLRAVLAGYRVPEVAPDPELRRRLEEEAQLHGPGALLERLRVLDPEGASSIDGRNVRRLVRAIEVSTALGMPFSASRRSTPRYRSTLIVLSGERAMLYDRADRRLEAMIAGGFVEEVAELLAAGYDLDLPAMSALGYREIGRMLRGEIDRESALTAIKYSTHAFIRRQITWFRAEQRAYVLEIADPALSERALEIGAALAEEARA
jgi:tRNA dimethylallyltransferase